VRGWWLLVALGVALAAAPPAAARASLTLDEARDATVRGAERPSAFTEANLPVGMPSVPRRWEAYGGFCHRQPKSWHTIPTVNCWVRIEFPDWRGCHIFDLWRASRRGDGPIRVRSLHQWTSDTTACPGDFDTITIEPVERITPRR
jgi:hypothetical protein